MQPAGVAGGCAAQGAGLKLTRTHCAAIGAEGGAAHLNAAGARLMNGFGHHDPRGRGLVDSNRNMSSIKAGEANNVAADDVRRDGVPTWRARVVHFNESSVRNHVVRETNNNVVANDVDVNEWVRRPAVG
ncbi:unannotated protein [freshwater metagenome]|uniref:Unannotated protein n=1 Tax=freshwater metagenome TaxID=449393 RepID=A0A6J6Q8C7_9ZZZZ